MNNNRIENTNPDAQGLLNQIVLDFMRERKRKRLWAWIKRAIIVIVLILLYFNFHRLVSDTDKDAAKPHAGLIDLKGTLFDTESGNGENFEKGMAQAYKKKGLRAMIIRINSPGGSPVQADYMFNTIQYYQKAYPKIPVYAVCADICASGAYYVASAAKDIYANESSLVGSIGVIYSGFGFVDSLQKLGVTRRVQTAGNNKAFLDPFLPEAETSRVFLQKMLDDTHQEFIKKVRLGRGTRLKENADIFSGLFWTGKEAIGLGLIDGFASSEQLVREKLKLKRIVDYTYKQNVFERVGKGIGMALVGHLPESLSLQSGMKAMAFH
jgi:protease-4